MGEPKVGEGDPSDYFWNPAHWGCILSRSEEHNV